MAARYLVAGGNGNWTSTTNWSATSGGASGASAPVSTDDVTMDANSAGAGITTDTSARACQSLTMTNWTGTLTMTNTLTVSFGITLGASMTFAGSAALIQNSTGTITSNGKTINIPFTIAGGTRTVTLADAMAVSGLMTFGPSAASSVTCNGQSITCTGGMTVGGAGTNISVSGTTTVTFAGTGQTLTGHSGSNMGLALTFNATSYTVSGTLQMTGSITHTAGTATLTGATLTIRGGTLNIDINGMGSWPTLNFNPNSAGTWTLLSDANCVDLALNASASQTNTIAGAFTIHCSGNISIGSAANSWMVSTTATIHATGSACVLSSASASQQLRVDIDIDTAGTFTLSGTVYYAARTISRTAGTIAGASTPVLKIMATGTTLDFNGASVPWSISVAGGTAQTVNQPSDLILPSGAKLICNEQDPDTPNIWRANSGGTQKKLTVQPGAIIDIGAMSFTDIDCSDGDELFVFKGTLTNCTNITHLTPYTSPLSIGGSGGAYAVGHFG